MAIKYLRLHWYHHSLWLVLIWGCLNSVVAETRSEQPAKLPPCTGENPDTNSWGMIGNFSDDSEEVIACSRGMAAVFHQKLLHGFKEPKYRRLFVNCCPMPEGSLSEQHSFHQASCPADSVVTGSRVLPRQSDQETLPVFELRCTQINTDYFELRPSMVYAYEYANSELGTEFRGLLAPKIPQTGRNMIPQELRPGIARESRMVWSLSGCLGYPWGSPMVKMGVEQCDGFGFAALYRKK